MPRILLYLFCITVITGCTYNKGVADDALLELYAKPVIIPFNSKEGYTINKLTGDSIIVIRNSKGELFKTGLAFVLTGMVLNEKEVEIITTKAVYCFTTGMMNNCPAQSEPLYKEWFTLAQR